VVKLRILLLSIVAGAGSLLGFGGISAAIAAPTSPSWSLSPMPATVQVPIGSLYAVSCPSATNCLAVGTDRRAFWLSGGAWQDVSPDLVPDSTSLRAVSCGSPAFCVVLSSAALLVWSGADWHTLAAPDGVPLGDMLAVSCTSATFCAATWGTATGGGAVGRWNAGTWTVDSVPVPGTNVKNHEALLNGISCVSPTACVVAGYTDLVFDVGRTGLHVPRPFAISYNGTTWTEHAGPSTTTGRLGAVSCWAANACAIVGTDFSGSSLFIYSNGTFRRPPVVGSTNPIAFAVSCTKATSCVAVGPNSAGGNAQRWNGTNWHAESAGIGTLYGVSCVAAGPCTAVGGNLVERDAGTWAQRQLPLNATPSAYHLNHVSCASNTWCAGTGDQTAPPAFGIWNGATWNVTALPTPIGQIDCPSTARCFGVTRGGLVTWTQNGGWQVAAVPLPLATVDCASPTSCVALGFEFAVGKGWHLPTYKWNGKKWARGADLVVPAPAQFFVQDLNCPTSGFCMAVGRETSSSQYLGNKPTAATWNGSAWKYRHISGSTDSKQGPAFSSVDCVSPTNCFAVGGPNGLAAHWDGSALTVARVPNAQYVTSVSCRTATSCVALTGGTTQYGDGGSALWNGTGWTPLPLASDPAGPGVNLEDVDCTSTQCLGVGLGDQPNVEWNAEAELLR
jgi:hypothetical protein